jgi:hypothetical protein
MKSKVSMNNRNIKFKKMTSFNSAFKYWIILAGILLLVILGMHFYLDYRNEALLKKLQDIQSAK